jgi:hypothetical protein
LADVEIVEASALITRFAGLANDLPKTPTKNLSILKRLDIFAPLYSTTKRLLASNNL